jgi:hypothetical protein
LNHPQTAKNFIKTVGIHCKDNTVDIFLQQKKKELGKKRNEFLELINQEFSPKKPLMFYLAKLKS